MASERVPKCTSWRAVRTATVGYSGGCCLLLCGGMAAGGGRGGGELFGQQRVRPSKHVGLGGGIREGGGRKGGVGLAVALNAGASGAESSAQGKEAVGPGGLAEGREIVVGGMGRVVQVGWVARLRFR